MWPPFRGDVLQEWCICGQRMVSPVSVRAMGESGHNNSTASFVLTVHMCTEELLWPGCPVFPSDSYAEILTLKGVGIRRRDLWEMLRS